MRAWLKPLEDYVNDFLDKYQETILRGDSGITRKNASPGGTFTLMVKTLQCWVAKYMPELTDGAKPTIIYAGLGEIAESLENFNDTQFQKARRRGC